MQDNFFLKVVVKILRRNFGHRNLIIFLVFSMVYLQAIYSLSLGVSLFSAEAIKSLFLNHYVLLLMCVGTIFLVYRANKISDKVLLFFLILMIGKNFILLSSSFNKLTLVLNFIYLIFAFYFYVMWELEVSKACFNPLFSKYDLEKESRFKLLAVLEDEQTHQKQNVLITNIDEDSCFLLLLKTKGQSEIFEIDQVKTYLLKIDYEGVQFNHRANLVSSYDAGIGMIFVREKWKENRLDWSDLYKVCLERGMFN